MAQVTTREYLAKIQNGIDAELTRNINAIPKGFNRQRFTLNCISMLRDNLKNWNNVDPMSMITTFAKGAYLGLDFFNGECYAIPYKGIANFQTDYKGEIKLCKKYSKNPIKDIYAKNVRRGDFFEEKIEDGKQTITFKPVSFSTEPIIGTFAVVLFADGSMIYETMSAEEIEKVRKAFSKAANSKAWQDTPSEMYKKTVLRRLCKMIDLDFDNAAQQKAFRDGGDFDPHKETVIDAAFSEPDTEPLDPFLARQTERSGQESRPEPARAVVDAPAQEPTPVQQADTGTKQETAAQDAQMVDDFMKFDEQYELPFE